MSGRLTSIIVAPFLLFIISISGCSSYNGIDPVGKQKIRLNTSVGGPFFSRLGPTIPLPYLTAGVSYGLEENLNFTTNAHLLPTPFGIGGGDVSVTWFPVLNDSSFVPNISIQPTLLIFFSVSPNQYIKDRFAIYPAISSAASWKLWIGTIYGGIDIGVNASLLPPFRPQYDANAQWIILSPFVGYKWRVSKKWKIITEVKFLAVNVETSQLVANYLSLAGLGTIAPYIGVQFDF